jgi:large subunit ribosomal protein L17
MRHGKTVNHLGRTSAHRKALLSNMASSLIISKRITTTLAKAKELRKYVEPLLSKAKIDSTNSRRVAFSYLQNKETIKVLFGEVAEKIGNRPGGYTRIIKTGYRQGDNADMCIIELVDFNELLLAEKLDKVVKPKTRRSRKSASDKVEGDVSNEATSETDVTEEI